MKHTAYLGLGSNLGDRAATIGDALTRLAGPDVLVRRISSLYESDPVGPVTEQPAFYNAIAEVVTDLEPPFLLRRCLVVEKALGRTRDIPKGPRTIDMDLVLMDQIVGVWPGLVLPHPELTRRAFVLLPLLELAPDMVDPRDGRPLAEYLALLRSTQWVRPCFPCRSANGGYWRGA